MTPGRDHSVMEGAIISESGGGIIPLGGAASSRNWGAASSGISNWTTLTGGIAGFFRPNPLAFFGPNVSLPADAAGFYSIKPLEKTLGELVDFARLSQCAPRLTVGAANLRTSDMRY